MKELCLTPIYSIAITHSQIRMVDIVEACMVHITKVVLGHLIPKHESYQ